MANQLNIAREYILTMLEDDRLSGGDKLPGAREFAEEVGVSLTIMQQAFVSLTHDGVLTSVPRRGTFVRHDWQDRILSDSFYPLRPIWGSIVKQYTKKGRSGLQARNRFYNSMFEIRTTFHIQSSQEDYLNLAPILEELALDWNDFFTMPFQSLRTMNGELFGIPLIFSPRVICYEPEMLKEAGCEEPRPGWGWSDFIALVRKLRRHYPGNRVMRWENAPYFWMNFIFRAGGAVIDRRDGAKVMLDDPLTRNGIALCRELLEALDLPKNQELAPPWHRELHDRSCALQLLAREDVSFASESPWGNIALPLIPGGNERTAQATELLCVRKHVGDIELVRDVIRFLLSQEVQDEIGKARHGIPVRQSSAIHSFATDDPRDMLFLAEMTKISTEYNITTRKLNTMIMNGLSSIWYDGADIDSTTSKMAEALRTMLFYKAL